MALPHVTAGDVLPRRPASGSGAGEGATIARPRYVDRDQPDEQLEWFIKFAALEPVVVRCWCRCWLFRQAAPQCPAGARMFARTVTIARLDFVNIAVVWTMSEHRGLMKACIDAVRGNRHWAVASSRSRVAAFLPCSTDSRAAASSSTRTWNFTALSPGSSAISESTLGETGNADFRVSPVMLFYF